MKKAFNHYQRGLSLVELLVSLLISSIIFGGAFSIVITSRNTFEDEQASSFVQENARYATEIISRDIRLAGSLGCVDTDRVKIANRISDDSAGLYSVSAISGYDSEDAQYGSDPNIPIPADAVSDAIVLRYADPDSEVYVSDHNASDNLFSLAQNHDFDEGDTLAVVDANCRHAGFFKNNLSDGDTVGYSDSCNGAIFSDAALGVTECNALTSPLAYSDGSVVMGYVAHAYYVADSNVVPGLPSLKRRVLTSDGYYTEELAQGVESIDILYGVDLDGEVVGDVDTFLKASEVSDWERVSAVRLSMSFRSQNQIFDQALPQASTAPEVDDSDPAVADNRYLTKLVGITVQMRNRYRSADDSDDGSIAAN